MMLEARHAWRAVCDHLAHEFRPAVERLARQHRSELAQHEVRLGMADAAARKAAIRAAPCRIADLDRCFARIRLARQCSKARERRRRASSLALPQVYIFWPSIGLRWPKRKRAAEHCAYVPIAARPQPTVWAGVVGFHRSYSLQDTAALQDCDPAYVGSGSFSSDHGTLPMLAHVRFTSKRVQTLAPQRNDATCHEPTHAVQQITFFHARVPRTRGAVREAVWTWTAGIIEQMCIPLCRLNPRMPEQAPDHRKRHAAGNKKRRRIEARTDPWSHITPRQRSVDRMVVTYAQFEEIECLTVLRCRQHTARARAAHCLANRRSGCLLSRSRRASRNPRRRSWRGQMQVSRRSRSPVHASCFGTPGRPLPTPAQSPPRPHWHSRHA